MNIKTGIQNMITYNSSNTLGDLRVIFFFNNYYSYYFIMTNKFNILIYIILVNLLNDVSYSY